VITPPKGLYIYGGVGTGKTFVMDLFYEVGLRMMAFVASQKSV
jgi:predicted ATPase